MEAYTRTLLLYLLGCLITWMRSQDGFSERLSISGITNAIRQVCHTEKRLTMWVKTFKHRAIRREFV